MIILASAFHSIGENKAETALAYIIEESLTLLSSRFKNIVDFVNDIMKDKLRQKFEQHLRWNLNKSVKKGDFGILNDISENFTLVQLLDTPGNVNHAIIIVG